MGLHFKHFQTRLLVLVLVPLLTVLAVVYTAVERANTTNALDLISRDLAIGADNFNAVIDERNLNLAIAGDAVSRDFAVRQAFNTDRATLLSALDNLLERLLIADFIAMASKDEGMLLVDTHRPTLEGQIAEWQTLIVQAQALDLNGEYPEASGVVLVDGRPYHITLLPFLTPDLAGWIALGFEVSNDFTIAFKQTVAADISVLYQMENADWQVAGSTLPADLPAQLITQFTPTNEQTVIPLANEEYVTLAQPLSENAAVQVVLQRSLTAQLAPSRALQKRLFTIFSLGVVVLLGVVTIMSRSVTKPLRLLTQGAGRISAGDYATNVETPHRDEIGQLATAFNAMASGLAEKERVRELLGKVVSPAIANELMSKPPELGGEEREVTVVFTDLRGFTSLCEGRSPQQMLALLNEYFSVLTSVIEQHGGVVDKYIGDAVMALFGAPVHCDDAADQALQAAMAVEQALVELNKSLAARGLSPLSTGIGINSDQVVVGNMGSQSRLNYTAIGDGVNLASRLESLGKRYGVRVIVSESTCVRSSGFVFLPLDLVRVKGKQQPVAIFSPVASQSIASPSLLTAIATFQQFLQQWQAGDWQLAADSLNRYADLARHEPLLTNGLVDLYRHRLQLAGTQAPGDWDGVYTFADK